MILDCPRCESQQLNNASHGTSACPKCGGVYVPLARTGEFAADLPAARDEVPLEGNAVRCPSDHSLMSRARVDTPGGGAVFIDRCGSCHGVWFDAGEWNVLASAHLLDHLDEFWSVEWRARQRHTTERAHYEQRLREEFGEELYGRIMDLAHELRGNPRRSEALALLREESASR